MAGKTLARFSAHDDQIGIDFARSEQDFLDGGTKGYAEFRFAPVFTTLGHQLTHANDIDLALAGNTFFCIGRGALDDVKETEPSSMFLGKGEGVGSSFFGAGAKIGGKENVLEFDFLCGVAFDSWADGHNCATGLTEDFFSDRADEDFLDLAAAMSAYNNEIDFVLDDELFEDRPDITLFHQNFVRYAAEFARDQNVGNAFFRSLANLFVSSLRELGLGKLEGIRSDHVGKVDAGIIAPCQGDGVIQGAVRNFGEIGSNENLGKQNTFGAVHDGLLCGLKNLRHSALLKQINDNALRSPNIFLSGKVHVRYQK